MLALHGAMVTESDDDAEGLVLQRVRDRLGTDIPVVVTLDLHAHVTQRMVDHATALVIYKTCTHILGLNTDRIFWFSQTCPVFLADPHIDSRSRAVEAVRVIADTVEGHVTPTMALAKPPIIPLVNMQFTARGFARELMQQLSALESATELTEPGTAPAPVESWSSGRSSRTEVISCSLAFGFPWADIPHVGMAFVVCTDDDQVAAQRIADRLATQAWERRAEFVCPLATPSEAVAEAIGLHAADGELHI